MKVTTETIAGKQCTVIWHHELSDPHTKELIEMAQESPFKSWRETKNGNYIWMVSTGELATALPSLPSKPKPSDKYKLLAYMERGIEIHLQIGSCVSGVLLGIYMDDFILPSGFWSQHAYNDGEIQITHATMNGERVNIAITESE